MVREAKIVEREHGTSPSEPGWFVLNAAEAAWVGGPFGAFTAFEGAEARFSALGVNIAVLQRGQPNCYYHAENEQEDFLVLDGECRLLVEGTERPLRRWDFVPCPAGTEHGCGGAGERPCGLLAGGTRAGGRVVYPDSELARRHRAGVAAATDDPEVAYAQEDPDVPVAFNPGWLPGT